MGDLPEDEISAKSLHMSMVNEVIGSDASQYLLHSYKKSFNGFLAKLTEDEAQKLEEMEGVVSVFPSKINKLHTTRSWDFLGVPLQLKRSAIESDVIIGVIDTGIWPESESFSDKGLGPPPSRWKGICQPSKNFTCNNKIIGARYFHLDGEISPQDLPSARDSEGHGTHCASTAAGNLVNQASLGGLGLGIARGGVPSARIAAYKVLWEDGSMDHDILAAFDAAIADGVDIISISVGGNYALHYFEDTIAIGAFHAMKKGILTSHSAGNEGPKPQTIGSVAPWSISVAASTIDRKYITMVQLGNNMVIPGISINPFKQNHMYPLILGEDAPNTHAGFNGSISRFCLNNTLDDNLVRGRIVVCDAQTSGVPQLLAGAVGCVMQQTSILNDTSFPFPLPVAVVSSNKMQSVSTYIKSSRNPTAVINKSTEGRDPLAPYVASFSSRGPNPISKNILKPDLSAPGVNILAAWSPLASPSDNKEDNRAVPYNIVSGTSMACPHVTGAAAYVKTFHPLWSPAAIKSALMTTASPMNASLNPEAEFAFGSGHIDIKKAVDPGLVYDANELDYIKFLCLEGYTTKQLRLVTGNKKITCSGLKKQAHDLNYPSIAWFTLRQAQNIFISNRTVTNVGSPKSTYKAIVTAPSSRNIQIIVDPEVLKFNTVGETKSFQVGVLAKLDGEEYPIVRASLIWDDGMHQVRTPIIVYAPS